LPAIPAILLMVRYNSALSIVMEQDMDGTRFDHLTRSLATGATRRSLLRSLGAGTIAGTLSLFGAGQAVAKGGKVGICHLGFDGTFKYIKVSASAIPDHTAHGDAIDPDFATNLDHCGGCGQACPAPPAHATAACDDGGCGWTCDAEYHPEGDGCVADDPCQLITSEVPVCYHLERKGPELFCWAFIGYGYDDCRGEDSCHDGGGHNSGGCFKWTNDSDDDFSSW
jgi:hypothetical protein